MQELTQRTGRNPSYSYVQIGCSKAAERAMLKWANAQVGKPFSTSGMAWSLVWPRESDCNSYYCAELVAACLQVGGLMSTESKPGAATPQSLYRLYRNAGAVAANPCALRREFGNGKEHSFNLFSQKERVSTAIKMTSISLQQRSNSPPRVAFKQIGHTRGQTAPAHANLSLNLTSLNMNAARR